MKCEKCGTDILEGTLCENCKNTGVTQEVNVNQVPVQYDPVKDLMDETASLNQVVIQDKDEIESTIPVGDNNDIPAIPVAEEENVINNNQVPVESTTLESSSIPAQENVVVPEQPQVVTQSQENTQVVEKPKKNNIAIFIIIGVILVLVVLVIVFVLPMLNATNEVNNVFDEAKKNAFVTIVQTHMDKGSESFRSIAMTKPATSIYFSNIGAPESEELPVEFENSKNYYLYLDRHGFFQKVIVYDDVFCYESPALDNREEFDKSSIKVSDLRVHNSGDSYRGCLGELISN